MLDMTKVTRGGRTKIQNQVWLQIHGLTSTPHSLAL